MDLSRCTPGQYSIVTTLDKPLMVSAGAGSGKTFTVTQRVVYALCNDHAENHINSLDEALIITFTKEAAKELRERIKNLLLEEGRGDLALQTDNAWISTIHGMASQILKQNALIFGLDPSFELISDDMVDTYTSQAFEIVIEAVKETGTSYQRAYLANNVLTGTGSFGTSVKKDVDTILSRVRSMPQGFETLIVPHATQSPLDILRSVVSAAEDFLAVALLWSKPKTTEIKIIDALQEGIAAAQKYLESAPADFQSNDAWFNEAFDSESYRSLLALFPQTSPKYREKKDDREQVLAWRTHFAHAYYEALMGCALPEIQAAVDIAQAVDEVYHTLKGVDKLDNTDLLVLLLKSFREHPEIAHRYRDQFKLIMVDEFQDTDKLQVAAIDFLAQDQRTNITTVGDAQQSIYRFRGADVNVFFDYRAELAENAIAQFVELPDNFRSHADILAFVEAIFSQPEVFGDDFLALHARGAVNQEEDAYFSDHPRIEVAFVQGSSEQIRVQETARLIADHCACLVDAGKSPSDIAVLVGRTMHVHIYAQALRNRGLDVVISGGSVYKNFDEAYLVGDLIAFAINHDDEEVLYRVLKSGAFDLSDDALLCLATKVTNAGVKQTSFCKSFLSLRKFFALDEGAKDCLQSFKPDYSKIDFFGFEQLSVTDKEKLCRASQVLYEFEQTLNRHEELVIEAIRVLLYNCGYYARLMKQGAQGMAVAGNINKSMRLLAELQDKTPSLPALQKAYASHLAFAQEKPGILQSSEMQCVRIMTTHASKGLEFPHVVVADLGDGVKGASGFVAENIGRYTYFTKFVSAPKSPLNNVSSYFEDYARDQGLTAADPKAILTSCTPADMFSVIKAYNKDQVLSEARRLLYVALTRASKSLFLICPAKTVSHDDSRASKDSSDKQRLGKGIYNDVESALQVDPFGAVQMISYGGSAPARVRVIVPQEEQVQQSEQESELLVSDAQNSNQEIMQQEISQQTGEKDLSASKEIAESNNTFIVPRDQLHPLRTFVLERRATRGDRENVYSYSSLSHEGYRGDAALTERDVVVYESDENDEFAGFISDEDKEFWDSSADGEDESATNLGTAFHHLCEIAITLASASDRATNKLHRPSKELEEAQAKRFKLSFDQRVRLDKALTRWFESDLAQTFASFGDMSAEVPFMMSVSHPETGEKLYLEGEIDGLALNDAREAMLIDYKTGGFAEESNEELYNKHLQQAQCYACALLKRGCLVVDAYFVRVEQHDQNNPSQPQIVSYHFDQTDREQLERAIVEHTS